MSKEVQQIKDEIIRLKEIAEYNLTHCKMDRSAWTQQAAVCAKLLTFIDAMPRPKENKHNTKVK